MTLGRKIGIIFIILAIAYTLVVCDESTSMGLTLIGKICEYTA